MSPEGREPVSRVSVAVAFVLALILGAHIAEYWFICDDAYISFRYARNLLSGEGLVFNPGERVEGYTNLAWVLELSALWGVLGWEPDSAAHTLSLLATVAVCVTTWHLSRDSADHWIPGALAVLLLALNGSFAAWSTSGLETRQFTALTLAGAVLMLHPTRARPWLAVALFFAAELTRPEGLLLGGGCCLIYAGMRLRRREFSGVTPGVVLGLLVGLHYLWRHSYYGLWLPNTYYAKHVGAWWESGARYFGVAAIEYALYWTVPLSVLGAVHLGRRRDDWRLAQLLGLMSVHALYIANVGGDHFEFRVLDLYWPILAVGVTAAGLATWSVAKTSGARRLAFGLGAVWLVGRMDSVPAMVRAQTRSAETRDATHGLAVAVHYDEHAALWPFVDLAFTLPLHASWSRTNAEHYVGLRVQEHDVFAQSMLADYAPYFEYADTSALRELVLGARTVGIIGYYMPNTTIIDVLGLTDATVARNLDPASRTHRLMAHDRKPPPGYLQARGVNAMHVWALQAADDALPRGAYAVPVTADLVMPLLAPPSP